MNKRRFIERLNLHLDNELTSDESEELMTAARSNPEYFRIYRQYCMINEACARLGEGFGAPAARSGARQTLYAVGGMAAAAALLFMAGRNLAPMVGREASAASFQPASPRAKAPAPQLVRFDVDSIVGRKAFEREPAEPSGGLLQFASFRVEADELQLDAWEGEYPFARQGVAAGFARNPELSDAPRGFDPRFASYSESAAKAFSASIPFSAEVKRPAAEARATASSASVIVSGR